MQPKPKLETSACNVATGCCKASKTRSCVTAVTQSFVWHIYRPHEEAIPLGNLQELLEEDHHRRLRTKTTKLPRESPYPHSSEQVLCLPQNRQHSCLKRTSLAERSKRQNSLCATMRRLRSHTADYTDDKAFRTPIATPSRPACSRRPQTDQCTNKKSEPCRVWQWKQSLEALGLHDRLDASSGKTCTSPTSRGQRWTQGRK